MHAFAARMNRWIRGQAPSILANWIACAPLTALRKPNRYVRSIAVDKTLQRLAGSILFVRHIYGAQCHLAPY